MKKIYWIILPVILLAAALILFLPAKKPVESGMPGPDAVPTADEIRTELIDPLVSFYPGTAGSSLGRAIAASKLLAFADRYTDIDEQKITLTAEEKALLAENLISVEELLADTQQDFEGLKGLYEDAGVYDAMQSLVVKPDIWEKADALIAQLGEL